MTMDEHARMAREERLPAARHAELDALDLVQAVRADEVEQLADPGLARGDDLPVQRVSRPLRSPCAGPGPGPAPSAGRSRS